MRDRFKLAQHILPWTLCFTFLTPAPVVAETDTTKMLAALEARVDLAHSSEENRKKIIEQGRDKAFFCANCHGQDGNSSKPDVPNLAGQNPVYLLQQINYFALSERQDYTTVMQQLASQLSDDEKLALAVYYANAAVKPYRQKTNPALLSKGKRLYQNRCTSCHGEDGVGQKGFARIAGQKINYIKRVLLDFRDNDRNRISPVMSGMVEGFSETDIAALANYIGQLSQ